MKMILQRAAIVILAIAGIYGGYLMYDSLRERSMPEKLAAIIHDEDIRTLTPRLADLIKDDSILVRARAAQAIGRIGDKKGGELLMEALHDPSILVASKAAFGLGLLGDKQYAEKLLEAAESLPGASSAQAVLAAGRLSDSSMVETLDNLTSFLGDASPEVREAACYGLFYAKATDQLSAVENLLMLEQDSMVQRAALFTLARLGADVQPVYARFLADADPGVRSLAVRGMGNVKTPEALQFLGMALNDVDQGVEAEAIAALAKQGSYEASNYLWRKLPQISGDKLTVALIDALAQLKAEQAIDAVTSLTTLKPSDNVLAAGMKYLATVQSDRAVNLIDSVRTMKPSPYVRAACVEAYGLMERDAVLPRVAQMFADEDPLVRLSAFEVLTKLDSANLDYYIGQALNDQDMVLLVTGVDAIINFKLDRFFPTLSEIMARGTEIDSDIRRTIIDGLPKLFTEFGKDSALVRLLIDGILDKEYIVRRSAAIVYEKEMGEDRWAQVPPALARITEGQVRSAVERYTVNPTARIITDKGEIELELRFDIAPLTVINFIELAQSGVYDGLKFHRVVPNFVVQGGDPRGDGWGGPGYQIRCEYSDLPYRRGTVGIATSGKDTGGSQFFIALSPQPHLNGRYTVFGEVTDGMEIADEIVRGDIIQKIMIFEGKPTK
ncbi:MAG: peptidylprolyl isomerase [bacterium]|nr:peptidylprolyl isomerase [bacterium]